MGFVFRHHTEYLFIFLACKKVIVFSGIVLPCLSMSIGCLKDKGGGLSFQTTSNLRANLNVSSSHLASLLG